MSKRNPKVMPVSKAIRKTNNEFGQALVPAELRRLKDIIAAIPGQRTYLVNRKVTVSRVAERVIRYEDVVFTVRAATMPDALRAADRAKYEHEYSLGHHHGKAA